MCETSQGKKCETSLTVNSESVMEYLNVLNLLLPIKKCNLQVEAFLHTICMSASCLWSELKLFDEKKPQFSFLYTVQALAIHLDIEWFIIVATVILSDLYVHACYQTQ